MNKTRFGISAHAYAALTFVAGLLGIIPVIIMAGAAMLLEENDWLKRMVAKAAMFVLLVAVASTAVGCLDNFFGIIENFIRTIGVEDVSFAALTRIIAILNYIIALASDIGLLVFAYQAFSGKYAKVPFVEKIVEKHM